MPRPLTSQEVKKVARLAKPDLARPYIYDAASGQLQQISKDFEIFLILTPGGVRNQITQYISLILKADINNLSVRNKLSKQWIDNEIKDLEKEEKNYDDILGIYDDLIPKLSAAKTGFEDVDEVNSLMSNFTLLTSDFGEQRDGIRFDKAVLSVLKIRESVTLPDDIKKEIQSYARALIAYD